MLDSLLMTEVTRMRCAFVQFILPPFVMLIRFSDRMGPAIAEQNTCCGKFPDFRYILNTY